MEDMTSVSLMVATALIECLIAFTEKGLKLSQSETEFLRLEDDRVQKA